MSAILEIWKPIPKLQIFTSFFNQTITKRKNTKENTLKISQTSNRQKKIVMILICNFYRIGFCGLDLFLEAYFSLPSVLLHFTHN